MLANAADRHELEKQLQALAARFREINMGARRLDRYGEGPPKK
jgi:hypothetical protein